MVGQDLAHYKILEKIGSGGMGDVYLAHDKELDRKVALKILPPEMAESDERRERFKREAKAVAALNHPNIVTVHSVEQSGGIHFITMELVRGKTLSKLVPRNGFPLDPFFDFAIPLSDAVATAHERGITHRDLKPDNVMVGDDGRVKVLDFGLAKESPGFRQEGSELQTQAKTQEGLIVGTLRYMSPEQARGQSVDVRSDIFSLGILLYEMATGRHPFPGDSPTAILSSIIKDTPKTARDVNPRLPRDLSKLIRRCLAKDPEDRLQSAKDLRNELRELKAEWESGDVETTRVAPEGNRKWMLGLGAAVVVSAVGTYLVMHTIRGAQTAPSGMTTTLTRLTSQAGQELFPSLSPDGDFLVYANDSAGSWDIYLQSVGGENAVNLTERSRLQQVLRFIRCRRFSDDQRDRVPGLASRKSPARLRRQSGIERQESSPPGRPGVSGSEGDSSDSGCDVTKSVPGRPLDIFQSRRLRGRRLATDLQRSLAPGKFQNFPESFGAARRSREFNKDIERATEAI